MKTIIAGSRTIQDADIEKVVKDSGFSVTEVFCGCARGVDASGAAWARKNNLPVREFPAAWETHGKAAGPLRNHIMAQLADALILIWDGQSRGSANMLQQARNHKLKVFEVVLSGLAAK